MLRRAVLLAVVSALPLAEAAKKSKFLSPFPGFIKFGLFWWCVIVFIIMVGFLLDQILTRVRGLAHVEWETEYWFDGTASRQTYWAQFANPATWRPTHPILSSADVRMVRHISAEDAAAAEAKAMASGVGPDTENVDDGDGPSARLVPLDKFESLQLDLGFVLRHKTGEDMDPKLSGRFYCARVCTFCDTPQEGPWRLAMRTVETSPECTFLPDTEEVEVELWPVGESGRVKCVMSGSGSVTSRFFRWWGDLKRLSVQGARDMMDAIQEEARQRKKTK